MLFNSTAFVFLFLPLALLAYFSLKGERRLWVLFAFSILFICTVKLVYAYLLLAYIIGNYLVSMWIKRSPQFASILFVLGIVGNIVPLIYFKYFLFIVDIVHFRIGQGAYTQAVIPLGISFYAFQQILYLYLIWKRELPVPSLIKYATFVSFFPHLLAGPITDPRRIIPQLSFPRKRLIYIAAGVSLFALGLLKKLVIADRLAQPADRIFDFLIIQPINPFEALNGVLAFTLQIYFDFSAYSDMAAGLACMFLIKLPLNFYSPYKSSNFVIFWRRWHITLGAFFHKVLFIPLHDKMGRIAAIIITFLLIGIWHGAGITFVLFGLYHGILTVFSYLFYKHGQRYFTLPKGISIAITFVLVAFGFGIFRAADMSSLYNLSVSLYNLFDAFKWNVTKINFGTYILMQDYIVIIAGLFIVFLLPSTAQLFPQFFDITYCRYTENIFGYRYRWRPSIIWAVITSIALLIAISHLGRANPFLYFQF